jgi:hypothetical protein
MYGLIIAKGKVGEASSCIDVDGSRDIPVQVFCLLATSPSMLHTVFSGGLHGI